MLLNVLGSLKILSKELILFIILFHASIQINKEGRLGLVRFLLDGFSI